MPENNMSEPAEFQLTTRDWNDEWKRLQQTRRRFDDAGYWDKRAATFSTKDAPNPYVERFLELAGIEPGETVFDMGCGTGALSVPLGKRSHKVVAADFSRGVTLKQMSWEDDWPSFGVRPGAADVALASRSVATADLKDSLLRLTDVARRRVCVTLATGTSPRTDERILNAIGLKSVLGRDYLYAFNILANEGLRPEVAYIDSTRTDTFDSSDEAYDAFARMANDATAALVGEKERAAALVRLRAWLADNLVANERAGRPDKKGVPEKALRLREPRVVTWAFLAWNI